MKGVLAYRVESRPVGDTRTMQPHAVAVCPSCEREHALLMQGKANNPEAIGERFRRAGFEFNPFKRASVRCPACIEKARRARAAIRPTAEVITMRPASPPPLGGVSAASPVSPEQRAKVRDLLTGVFGERGFYLDHYTDQRVAQECGVSAQMVREMRDAWLGPIKTVPELDGLQADVAALRKRADTAIAEAREIDQVVAAMEKRLEETRRQLGVAA